MINSMHVFSSIEINKKIEMYEWHNSKLYPFFFQEKLYMMVSQKNLRHEDTYNNFSKTRNSFYKTKRHINAIRLEGYLKDSSFSFEKFDKNLLSKERKKSLNEKIFEFIPKILDFEESKDNYIVQNKLLKKKWNTYSSVHSGLSSLENKWQSYDSVFEGKVPSVIHPEMLVRILRTQIEDVSLIHLFRQILHKNICELDKKNSLNKNFVCSILGKMLLNWYTLEYDKFFVLNISPFLLRKSSLDKSSMNDLSSVKKIRIWNSNVSKKKEASCNKKLSSIYCEELSSYYEKNSITYKYIRAKNICFLNLQNLSKKKSVIEHRYLKFLQYRIGFICNSNKLKTVLVETPSFFLGFLLQFKIKNTFIRIHIYTDHLKCLFTRKCLVIFNPLVWLMRILATYRFCTSFGYPISKSAWSTCSDITIIDRFKRIRNSLLKYYSGSINQKDLSRINHILHYSCAKTLACKHKTNLRKIWKKYGKQLVNHYQGEKTRKVLLSETNLISYSKMNIRWWNSYLKKPDPMSTLLENIYRLQKK